MFFTDEMDDDICEWWSRDFGKDLLESVATTTELSAWV